MFNCKYMGILLHLHKNFDMSDFLLYLDCEDYLRQWIVCTNGGNVPVKLKKGSPEAYFLEAMLQKPGDRKPILPSGDNQLCILIPQFRHKPPETYNYLSPTAREAFLRIFRRRFDFEAWKALYNLSNFFARKDLVIASWMEANGIELTDKNELAVTKRIQRLADKFRAAERMKKTRKSN